MTKRPALTVDYLAREYGMALTAGGSGRVVAAGLRLAQRLADANGADLEEVLVAVAERAGDFRA